MGPTGAAPGVANKVGARIQEAEPVTQEKLWAEGPQALVAPPLYTSIVLDNSSGFLLK